MNLSPIEQQKLLTLLSESKRKFGTAAVERLEEMLAIALGSKPANPCQEGQEGAELLFPGLSARAWHDPADFPIAAKLDQAWETIRQELETILNRRCGFQQYLRGGADKGNLGVPEQWKALFLKEVTVEFDENKALCPETSKILDSDPSVANLVMFSALDPGGYIAPHNASYNWILNLHLGLIIPKDCGVRVGAETRTWEEGKSLIFDASFEHEAWNNGDATRFILLVNIWHPDLTDLEIAMLDQANWLIGREEVTQYTDKVRERKEELQGEKWWT